MTVQLGVKVKDKITGFEGTVTGRAEYLTGCTQICVVPKAKADGSAAEAVWFDEQRLDVDDSVKRVRLDNGSTPGCDMPSPAAR